MKCFLSMLAILALGTGSQLTGCQNETPLDPSTNQLGRATGPVDPKLAATPHGMQNFAKTPPSGAVHRGKVLEKIQVPKYTYLKLEPSGNSVMWTAIPKNESVEVGQTVNVMESLVMKSFTSRTLNRTFDTIIFGVLAPKEGEQKLPPGHPPVDEDKAPTSKTPPEQTI